MNQMIAIKNDYLVTIVKSNQRERGLDENWIFWNTGTFR